MTKTLTAIAAVATLAFASIAAPQPAEARNGRIAAGVIGGLAAGAIIGGALSSPRYGGYYGGPVYYGGPAYYAAPRCYVTRERYWNGWRWRSHRVRVCN